MLEHLLQFIFHFKAKVITNKYGEIKEFDIIDGGYGFSSIFDEDDLIFSHQANGNHVGVAALLGYLPDGAAVLDETFNLDPDTHFPKQDLILTADSGSFKFKWKCWLGLKILCGTNR